MKRFFLVLVSLLVLGGALLSGVYFFSERQNVPLENNYSGWPIYVSPVYGFSVTYPPGFTIREDHIYTALGPDRDIPGVAFVVPSTLVVGTNLSADSYMSIETRTATPCTPALFTIAPTDSTTVSEYGLQWTGATGRDAGAGNYYDETVYTVEVSGICYGVRLFIHTTALANYEPGTRNPADTGKLYEMYTQLRSSFIPSR